jgi:glucan phosphoethanolaminetransferase (alkaline phosphatase superfamily)
MRGPRSPSSRAVRLLACVACLGLTPLLPGFYLRQQVNAPPLPLAYLVCALGEGLLLASLVLASSDRILLRFGLAFLFAASLAMDMEYLLVNHVVVSSWAVTELLLSPKLIVDIGLANIHLTRLSVYSFMIWIYYYGVLPILSRRLAAPRTKPARNRGCMVTSPLVRPALAVACFTSFLAWLLTNHVRNPLQHLSPCFNLFVAVVASPMHAMESPVWVADNHKQSTAQLTRLRNAIQALGARDRLLQDMKPNVVFILGESVNAYAVQALGSAVSPHLQRFLKEHR